SLDVLHHGDGRLDLNSILFRVGNSVIFLSGEYNLTDRKLNAIKITSEDVSLEDLRVQVKNAGQLSGSLRGGLDLDFPGKGIKGVQINGSLSGKDITFIPGLLPLPVSNCSFRLDLSGKKGFINQLDMKFGEHPLRIKGILHGWDSIKGDLLATTDFVDLTELILNNKNGRNENLFFYDNMNFLSPDITLKLNATKGIWRRVEFSRLNAEINFSEKDIKIKNAQAELDTGDLSATGTIGRRDPVNIDISGRINLEKQPVDKLISDAGFGDMNIKGALSLKSSINFKGTTNEGLLKNLSGNIDSILITKGLIKNSKVFLKILDGLNIPDKFRERPEDMREEGFYFHSIEGTGIIENGILKTHEFIVKSPVFNAVGSGEENLYERIHNIRLLVQPLTNIDYIINKIPLVGPIFSDDNETIFTVGYDVKGTWDKPDLDYAPSENLKGLGNVLKRAILTPFRIIENIGNAAKGMKKSAPEVIDGAESSESKE
ncbi:MAG: AsmA-like C-terminal region-containing protein, partial [Deltaproteobacteria bacterium]|nr:AsmA-like C-terminal region-containing protein [Deltaproteobacteria bacterium]